MTRPLAVSSCWLLLLVVAVSAHAAPPEPGFHARVVVSAPTRLDWTFVLATQSLDPPPAKWLGDYDSTKQSYQLFVPWRRDTRTPLPLLLYVSPGDGSEGWKHFQGLAQAKGFLFAAPAGVGNDCPSRRRVRILLDVLDDVRRHYPVDPDRTYLAGMSGGARMASAVAFALPELFGGLMSIAAAGELRGESWLRQRVVDRLSVALITGESDFNRGEVERWRGTYFKEVGVRTRVWTVAGLGHAIPGQRTLARAMAFLAAGLKDRRTLAKTWPASRCPGTEANRESLAKALLAEGTARLHKPKTLYSGLMQLQGVIHRWPDLEPAKAARKILLDYDAKAQKPWKADAAAEERRFLAAEARGLDRYATGRLPSVYQKLKPAMLRAALSRYEKLAQEVPETPVGKEAMERVKALEQLLKD
jgi:poly(3-hydroxybutyrate) depolymerase